MTIYCDQGHPAHDSAAGCGPCRDERDAGLGERLYADPIIFADPLAPFRSAACSHAVDSDCPHYSP